MSEHESASEKLPIRSDAQRNRERVREAALQVLAQQGSDATILDVARQAGVGKATVYRNFPTKAAILAFAVEHHGQWLVERLDSTIEANDGWAGFQALVRDTMLRIRREPILLEALRPSGTDASEPTVVHAINERLACVIQSLCEQGHLRPDVTVGDLGLLVIGTSQYLADTSAGTDECLRAAELVSNALRQHPDDMVDRA
ncbi:TetR/AcrR family transcriptional regulator [Alicyclobacillus fodiniaquatilis]|uniref:TetR/AcrR family transcriptional regulator n=1 Tax=Alicyclobacillus fodiniaquatilis TaxID=1661150 RepID=A0ABW4JEZ1_9BACL